MLVWTRARVGDGSSPATDPCEHSGRSQAAVDDAVARIIPGECGEVLGFAGDLSTLAAAEALTARFPNIEVLVNNLGIFELEPFEDIPDDDWMRFFEVNVLSGVRLARLCLPAMKRANWGRIIFISSESALQIPAEMIHYGMTKTAQLAVARGLAESLVGTDITVNSVLPGPTKSRGVGEFVEALAKADGKSFESFEKEFFEKARPTSLIKRFEAPQEIASMVTYIASPLCSGTTGAALRVDGGFTKSVFQWGQLQKTAFQLPQTLPQPAQRFKRAARNVFGPEIT